MTASRSQPRRASNLLAASVAWAEFLTLTGFCVYAFGPIIWEMVK